MGRAGGNSSGSPPTRRRAPATAALILGICALVVCGPKSVCPLAIISTALRRRRPRSANSNGRLTGAGRGSATAGVIMG